MSQRTEDRDRLLRLALRVNAGFSSLCALLFVSSPASVGAWTGAPTTLVMALGLGLLTFAGLLVTTSRRSDPARMRSEARVHCAADLAWVVGSVPVIALGWLTPAGSTALAGVSTVVFALAVAQWRGLGGRAARSIA